MDLEFPFFVEHYHLYNMIVGSDNSSLGLYRSLARSVLVHKMVSKSSKILPWEEHGDGLLVSSND